MSKSKKKTKIKDEEVQHTVLDLDLVQKNVPKYSSQKLCEMIVCDRYFGFKQKVSVICMEELSKRRVAGDVFNFEDYIEAAYKELPQLNFDMPDLRTILSQVVNQKIK